MVVNLHLPLFVSNLSVGRYPREAYVKTSPVAQLQVSSPEVGPHNIRSDSISPQASPMLFERMITPRKGLGAPSGAKPRRSVDV